MSEKLTLDYVIKNKFTGLDCVRYFKPNYSKKKCNFILWEMTCFPFCSEKMIEQLNELFIKNGKAVNNG